MKANHHQDPMLGALIPTHHEPRTTTVIRTCPGGLGGADIPAPQPQRSPLSDDAPDPNGMAYGERLALGAAVGSGTIRSLAEYGRVGDLD